MVEPVHYHFERLQIKVFKHPLNNSLLNPAKNHLDRISKSILDRINTSLRNLIQVNQWKDTSEVIEWFKNIRNKQKHKFTLSDIKDFYLAITEDLLTNCLNFADEKVQIFDQDKKILYHAIKSLLFNEKRCVNEKDGLFDVKMEVYDGAEVCELVGTFLYDKISENMIKVALVYIVTTSYQYLKTKVALNLKE